jgi:hypothetical protein
MQNSCVSCLFSCHVTKKTLVRKNKVAPSTAGGPVFTAFYGISARAHILPTWILYARRRSHDITFFYILTQNALKQKIDNMERGLEFL